MTSTKWWKCDLQVATPAWEFKFPAGSNYRLRDVDSATFHSEQTRFLHNYMRALKAKGIEVIALADHNTGSWIDAAKAIGDLHGIVVFPGLEVTTGTGADGAHLILIGERNKTSRDFEQLLWSCCGFSAAHPLFVERGGRTEPAASPKTAAQILDDLPDGYLAIAPHIFNENGLASERTVKADIRWKSLHHERLVAVDAGDCSNPDGDRFKSRFQRRELDGYPRLPELAFVATSDAYCMEDFGKRFTWIRMAEPTLEALRQACLDHEARIRCDWSPDLGRFVDKNPNNIRHAWISSVRLEGELGNSNAPLDLNFHPNLAGVEEPGRYRLASQLPDDVVAMEFLREAGQGGRGDDWQSVVKGSPGQRTAAMLAFVLHHGTEPLILDQPEDDLDSEWIFRLVVKELRQSRWSRQLIVVSHNANIPVLGDAEQVIALENREGALAVRVSTATSPSGEQMEVQHVGPVEAPHVRGDIQTIMEGGVAAFVKRELKYNNETRPFKTY